MNLLNLEDKQQISNKDHLALTEASSQFNGEWCSNKGCKDFQQYAEQDNLKNRGQNKLKYKKLTQKLNTMGHQHQDKFIGSKDVVTPNKQKIMRYIIQFQRQLKSQTRDHYLMEMSLKEILKVIETKNEQDLHILRNSRLIPVLFQVLQKIPSLHKNQMPQAIRVVELGLKILHVFSTLSINRDYLIMTKRLKYLVSLTSWMLSRDEKRTIYLCFKLMNILILHKNREQEDIKVITKTTIQLIIFSQMFKKIKAILETLWLQGYFSDGQLLLEILKFVYNILKSRREEQRLNNYGVPIYNQQQIKSQSSLYQLIEYLLSFFTKFLVSVADESDNDTQILPSLEVQAYYLIMRIINTTFQLSYVLSKKQIELDRLFPVFLKFIRYCKKLYQDKPDPKEQLLLNEILILVGYIVLDSQSNQRRLVQSLIFEELCNLPIQFLMDSQLKNVIIPTMCCIIHSNKTTMSTFLKDNSPISIIKYLKKEMQGIQSSGLNRKNSTKSLKSLALGITPMPISQQIDRVNLINRFPVQYWIQLLSQLERYNEG